MGNDMALRISAQASGTLQARLVQWFDMVSQRHRAPHPRPAPHRDAWISLVSLLGLAVWDMAGLDLAMTRWIAGEESFPWRHDWLASRVLHDGGRILSAMLMALLVWDAMRPVVVGPSRSQRVRTVAVVLSSFMLVPLLKRFSATSCPWDLVEFGGQAAYVPHWWPFLTDGGPGHCFPSGHAVAAFAFFGVYFLWRDHRRHIARTALVAILALGMAFGWAQWARGAHFVSHTLWSAWLCWVIAALAAWRWPAVTSATESAGVDRSLVLLGWTEGSHEA